MTGELALLLGRVRARLEAAGKRERVRGREAAALVAELGRPLPRLLVAAWRSVGAARLGTLRLSGPAEIADGLPFAERWLDQGLLPVGATADGDPLLLRLAGTYDVADDPEVLVAADFPRRVQVEVGPLSRLLEAHLLGWLSRDAADDAERQAVEIRIARLDPDGRLTDPLAWDERRGRSGIAS